MARKNITNGFDVPAAGQNVTEDARIPLPVQKDPVECIGGCGERTARTLYGSPIAQHCSQCHQTFATITRYSAHRAEDVRGKRRCRSAADMAEDPTGLQTTTGTRAFTAAS